MTTTQLINHYCFGTCPLNKEQMKKDFILSNLKGICYPELKPKKDYCICIDKSGLEEYILKNPCCVSYEKWEAQLQKCCIKLDLKIELEEVICKLVLGADVEKVNCGITIDSEVDEKLCDLLLDYKVAPIECKTKIETYIKNV